MTAARNRRAASVVHFRLRLWLRAERLGAGWFTVEQHVYADADGVVLSPSYLQG